MKTLILILTLILLHSCGESQTANRGVGEIRNQKQEAVKKMVKSETREDFSYGKVWCSIEVLRRTEENLTELDLAIVEKFLSTFHEVCSNNIEFSEWSNELLYKVAEIRPDLILQLLNENDSLNKKLIRNGFENPVKEGYDLVGIIKSMERATSPKKIKDEIIESLNRAKGN